MRNLEWVNARMPCEPFILFTEEGRRAKGGMLMSTQEAKLHQQLDHTTLSVQLSTILMLRAGRHEEEVMPRPISNALLHLVLQRLHIMHMSMSGGHGKQHSSWQLSNLAALSLWSQSCWS